MTTPTKTCALGVGTRQLQRNTKKQKEQTQMQNTRSLIRAPNPNSVCSIHPRALAPSWPPRCYATHIYCCRGSRRKKNPKRESNSFLRRGERERDRFLERERERKGNEDRKRMVRGTTCLLEIIAASVCESTEWDPLGDRHGCSIVAFFKHWWCHQHLR
jgi:hypothetical protein